MIATSTASPGNAISRTRTPTSRDSSGSVNSDRFVVDRLKVISRTRSPVDTASSTSADSIRGVETDTSTPHCASNIHSLPGWFTRPTVRGTPNSVLASSENTRFDLSSPVAAMATS